MLNSKSHVITSNDNHSSYEDSLILACEKAERDALSSDLISMDDAYFTAWEKRLTQNISVK